MDSNGLLSIYRLPLKDQLQHFQLSWTTSTDLILNSGSATTLKVTGKGPLNKFDIYTARFDPNKAVHIKKYFSSIPTGCIFQDSEDLL